MKINRNILWTETFVKELSSAGVKYACISPGSRNTPLTLAFANNKKIKSFVHIDERSCAFFGLGLAKSSRSPVVLVSTSGTATAELYPAIIEAYQQRIPLIVCTADRPPELLDCGANQTINQNNLYKNHIRWFLDVGLPEPITRRIKHIKVVARRAVYESLIRSKGPVHLNFPFRKPFEPDAYTDDVGQEILDLANELSFDKEEFFKEDEKNISNEKWFIEIFNHLKNYEKGLIIAGPENYDPAFNKKCQELSQELGYPILADGASQLRFGSHNKKNVLSNFEGFLRSEFFINNNKPDIILQFGRTITSKTLDIYLEKCSASRFMINEFGDWFDPSNKATAAVSCKPFIFCEKMLEIIYSEKIDRKINGWLSLFIEAEKISDSIKDEIINESDSINEARIVTEIINNLPENSHVMISNSMPIRDFDYFAGNTNKNIAIYNNRGASGIDGIISTALGIAADHNKPAFLITGDLAFYYDLNGLLAAKKYSIPLIIILINNNGGGIFEVLPISKYKDVFNEFFLAPHFLDFSYFVKGYGGNYFSIEDWESFHKEFQSALNRNNFSVLEIKTDAAKSLELRKKYWHEIEKQLMQLPEPI
ncbi:MAG: 2-succinyl-5-enolpyruvyl-6-hydroxy-3-cyclohexene-1-carboxylic-acid synthase [Ignavibacteriaceae bacterium]